MHDPELEAAYHSTTYSVFVPGQEPISIRCGARCMPLDLMLAESRATQWAFLTACNPLSERLDEDANAERMMQLELLIRGRGLSCLHGEGRSDDEAWPPEPSLLVLGIAEADAVAVAREFGQHAIVAGSRGGEARLVWVASS
ncbi:MAG: DUF3293 domain-containing protein [Planctomycetaceae bacterium]